MFENNFVRVFKRKKKTKTKIKLADNKVGVRIT